MAPDLSPQVTILIPNRNEPQVRETVDWLDHVLNTVQRLGVEIIVEDDLHSSGVGATLRRGLERVQTPWVIFCMADGSEAPRAIRWMIQEFQHHPLLVVGDRWQTGKTSRYPRVKRVFNRLANYGIAWRLGIAYYDWTDLAKAYRTAALRQITWSDDFRCAIEIPIRYCKTFSGPPPPVVPMIWQERTEGRSAYPLHKLFSLFVCAWQETRP